MSDLISRTEAINLLDDLMHSAKSDDAMLIASELACRIEQLPSAQPERKKGKWIDYCGGLKCDQCEFECDDPYYLGEANYCPNCGTRMEES